jgi:hypothetical protein
MPTARFDRSTGFDLRIIMLSFGALSFFCHQFFCHDFYCELMSDSLAGIDRKIGDRKIARCDEKRAADS